MINRRTLIAIAGSGMLGLSTRLRVQGPVAKYRIGSVAVFTNPGNEAAAPMVKLLQSYATGHGMRAQFVDVSNPDDLEAAFAAIRREGTESILLPPEPLIRSNRERIGGLAQAHGFPQAVVCRRHPPAVSGRTCKRDDLADATRTHLACVVCASIFGTIRPSARRRDARCLPCINSKFALQREHAFDRSFAEFPRCPMWQCVRSVREGIGKAFTARLA